MTTSYAPDLAELTEKARSKPMTPQQRESALDRLAEQRIGLLDELAQLDATITGYQQAQAREQQSVVVIENLLRAIDELGYLPKTLQRCQACGHPSAASICQSCEVRR
ncbi:hypothetical protein [Deinococcus aquatilis]|uniref:hypothetical protein n=1 Tax=Deinococcus aquatilis TaxID=519440 RepID=UPI0003717E8A|nr:hypothetical protein [Deinococcus aquatilis]